MALVNPLQFLLCSLMICMNKWIWHLGCSAFLLIEIQFLPTHKAHMVHSLLTPVISISPSARSFASSWHLVLTWWFIERSWGCWKKFTPSSVILLRGPAATSKTLYCSANTRKVLKGEFGRGGWKRFYVCEMSRCGSTPRTSLHTVWSCQWRILPEMWRKCSFRVRKLVSSVIFSCIKLKHKIWC